MKKVILFISILILSQSLFGTDALDPQPAGQEKINNFTSEIRINTNGTIDVKEEIEYSFDTPRRGIFREIPLTKENQDGKKFLMKAKVISVTDKTSRPIKFQNNSTKRQINLKIGDPNKTITGTHTYIIRYQVSGAITYFSDRDELYWNVTGNEWDVPIDKSIALVYYPNEINKNYDVICFTGQYASTNQNCRYKGEDNYVIIESLESYDPGESFTLAFKFPKGFVQVLEPKPDRSNIIEAIIIILIVSAGIGFYLILPIALIIKALKKLKKHPNENRVVAAWFNPPKTISKRELTAGEVGVLFDRSADIRDLSATLLQLAQNGFIKISEQEEGKIIKKKKFSFTKVKDWEASKELQEFEKFLLKSIFTNDKNVVSVNELGKRTGFASKIDKFFNKMSEQLVKDKLLEENPHKIKKKWTGILILGAILINPLLVIASVISLKAVKRTPEGAGALAIVKSLKNFVTSQEKQIEFQAKNQMMFEKLLPYATALGIEKIWIERFKDIQLTQPEWLETSDFSTVVYASILINFNNSISSATSMSSSRSSSGFSGGFSGGGFSGGGGGGGGGGSW